MSFSEIARLVGPLPASAAKHQAWWENESGAVVTSKPEHG